MRRRISEESISLIVRNGGKMSDKHLAEISGCSKPTVAKIRREHGIRSIGVGRPKINPSASSTNPDTDTSQA